MNKFLEACANIFKIPDLRRRVWLSLDPPKPEYGISFPPLQEGGWWLMAAVLIKMLKWLKG